jgi:hypothetical protein
MTEYTSGGPGSYRPEAESTGQVVREQAASVGQGATQAGGRVAQTAAEQGREVARETRAQARNLVNEATSELTHQTSMQQKRAAEGLRALGSELHNMASRSEQGGLAGELVAQAADRAHQAAHWLEHRQPGEVLDEVRALARRHPGAFLAGAMAAGIIAGRLTRNIIADGGTGYEPHPTEAYPETAQARTQPVVTEPLPPSSTTYASGNAATGAYPSATPTGVYPDTTPGAYPGTTSSGAYPAGDTATGGYREQP